VTELNLQENQLDEYFSKKTYDLLIVIGGDGSLRTVVDYCIQRGISIPISIIPRGSANVVAKSLNIPHQLSRNIPLLHRRKTLAVDVARLSTGQYMIGAFAMGYLSERVTKTPRWLKQHLGFFAYLVSFIRQTKLPLHAFSFSVNGQSRTVDGHTLFIVNTANFFGVHSKRAIDVQDGIFELVVTTNTTFLALIPLIWEFYFHTKEPHHFVYVRGSSFQLEIPGGISLQIDGEKFPHSDRLEINVEPRRQLFIVP
jgi:diacylglycerol kinase (ATP)